MVGRKLEMSTRSGSNYLTLAGKSRFWYQIAAGALRPGFMSILVYNHLDGEERAACLALFVFLVSRDGCVALPRGAMGLSSVCDCGIFRSYSLFLTKLGA